MATSFDELINSLHNNAIITDDATDDKIILINDKRQFIPGSAFNTEIAFEGDINSQVITFKCIRRPDSHDLSLCQYKQLKWKNIKSNIDGVSKLVVVNGSSSEEYFYVKWELPPEICTLASAIEISVQFYDKDENSGLIAYSWNTGLYRALSIGKSLSSVDFDFPARDEILIIDRETRNIVAPVGYNNVVCNYGDIGVARVAFLTERYVGVRKDLDVLATNVDIILFVQSGEWSTSYSLSDKKLYTAELSDRNKEGLVYFEWFPDEEFTTSDKLIGNFDVSIQFRNGEKTWNSNTYSNLKIAETTIMMNSGEEAEPVPAASVVDIINRQLLNEDGELKEEYIPNYLESSVNILNEDMPIYKNKTEVLEKKVSNLEAHINQDYFFTSNEIAYETSIPENACTYAQINKIYGATSYNNSLAQYSAYELGSQWKNLEITTNEDLSVRIKGTFHADGSNQHVKIWFDRVLNLEAGDYVFFAEADGVYPVNNLGKFILKTSETPRTTIFTDVQLGDKINFSIDKSGNYTLYFMLSTSSNNNNGEYDVLIKPMMNKGTTIKQWKGLTHAKTKSIISKKASGENIDTFIIPKEIQELLGYGEGDPSFSDQTITRKNYIDLNTKEYVYFGSFTDGKWQTVSYSGKKIDVSNLLSESTFIKVDGGGKLVPELEEPIDIRTDITYLLKEGSI